MNVDLCYIFTFAVADPGFPVGGGGRGFPKRLRFENFVCQNERIWTLGGGVRRAAPSKSANGLCYLGIIYIVLPNELRYAWTYLFRWPQFKIAQSEM